MCFCCGVVEGDGAVGKEGLCVARWFVVVDGEALLGGVEFVDGNGGVSKEGVVVDECFFLLEELCEGCEFVFVKAVFFLDGDEAAVEFWEGECSLGGAEAFECCLLGELLAEACFLELEVHCCGGDEEEEEDDEDADGFEHVDLCFH